LLQRRRPACSNDHSTPARRDRQAQRCVQCSVQNPRIKSRLEEAGLRLVGARPERLRDQIATEYPRWAKVVKANNIKAE
jgi:tripartite-type tricarboxylate transporter receptor subunit TctC